LGLWLVLRLILRDRHRAGLVASLVVVAFFMLWGALEDFILVVVPWLAGWRPLAFYGAYAAAVAAGLGALVWHYRAERRYALTLMGALAVIGVIWMLIAMLLLSPVFGRRAAWLITGYLIVFVAALAWVLRYRGDLRVATRSMNWFGGVLIGLYVAVFVINAGGRPADAPPPLDLGAAPAGEAALPDIYLIALDGYARSDVLRDTFGYNNLPFEDAMRAQGFEFAAESRANYDGPTVSLAALLNLDYLEGLLPHDAARGEDNGTAEALALYHENRAFRFLKERGYELLAFSPGLVSLEPRPPVDVCLSPPRALNEVEVVLLERTVVSRFMQVVYYAKYRNPAYWRFAARRKRILYAFDELGRLAEERSEAPRFVFAHLLIPGSPFLFTRTGDRAQPFGAGSLAIHQTFRDDVRAYLAAYVDQLHFTNHALQQAAARIVEQSKRPAVVIVVSTRGAALVRRGPGDSGPSEPQWPANLVSVRFPEPTPGLEPADSARLYDSISLVNVLRVTFNRVFGAGLPLLPDEVRGDSTGRPGTPAGVVSSSQN
ncbi:MAG: hypothetical protein JXR94_12615, partial [Candidatus Hydrogenedentes bacterium]|nr:hypothetical protein [Candidatus Hydrogenedentota bacterium]